MGKFILITTIVIAIQWLLDKLINCIFNILALIKKDCGKQDGVIYNLKNKKLEADGSNITLF